MCGSGGILRATSLGSVNCAAVQQENLSNWRVGMPIRCWRRKTRCNTPLRRLIYEPWEGLSCQTHSIRGVGVHRHQSMKLNRGLCRRPERCCTGSRTKRSCFMRRRLACMAAGTRRKPYCGSSIRAKPRCWRNWETEGWSRTNLHCACFRSVPAYRAARFT